MPWPAILGVKKVVLRLDCFVYTLHKDCVCYSFFVPESMANSQEAHLIMPSAIWTALDESSSADE